VSEKYIDSTMHGATIEDKYELWIIK